LGTGYAENERPPGGGKDFPGLQNDPNYFATLTQAPTEPINPPEYPITNPYQGMNQAAYQGIAPTESYLGQYAQDDPYGINQAAYGGYQSGPYQNYQTDPYASYLDPETTPWTSLQPDQYYGTSNYGWATPAQQPMNYEDYAYSEPDYTSYGQDYQDWGSAYDTGGDSYSYDSYDTGGGGGGDSYDYGGDYSDWYSEAY
jgi:hypothetical protein